MKDTEKIREERNVRDPGEKERYRREGKTNGIFQMCRICYEINPSGMRIVVTGNNQETEMTGYLNRWEMHGERERERDGGEKEREMFYLTTHSTHFIYSYMASDIWLRTILIVRKATCCRHIGYSYRLTARFFLYAPSNRQDNTYHGLCYTSRGALAGTRNSSMGPPHEGSIRRPIAP